MTTTIEVPDFWFFCLPCGCPYGSLVADQSPHAIIATEEQAWADFYDGRKARGNKDKRAGYYVRPVQDGDWDRFKIGHGSPDCSLNALETPGVQS